MPRNGRHTDKNDYINRAVPQPQKPAYAVLKWQPCWLQLRREDVDWAALRITHQRAVLVKSWDVHLDRAKLPVSFSLNAAAGLTWQGGCHIEYQEGFVESA